MCLLTVQPISSLSVGYNMASKTYTAQLFNLEGKALMSKRISGRSTFAITRQHQATGIYWLSIYDENRKQLLGSVKLVKE